MLILNKNIQENYKLYSMYITVDEMVIFRKSKKVHSEKGID